MTSRPPLSPFWRYMAFQVPGWIIASAGGWWAHRWLDVSAWFAVGVLAVWVVKDLALYPCLRSAYEVDERRPIERMVALRGTAAAVLSPSGYVRVRGELWLARVEDARPVAAGDPVEVTRVDGTTLIVKPMSG